HLPTTRIESLRRLQVDNLSLRRPQQSQVVPSLANVCLICLHHGHSIVRRTSDNGSRRLRNQSISCRLSFRQLCFSVLLCQLFPLDVLGRDERRNSRRREDG